MKNILGGTLEVLKEETNKGVKTAASQVTGKQLGQIQKSQKSQGQAQKTQSGAGVSAQGAIKNALGISSKQSESVQNKTSATNETKSFVKDLYGGEKPQMPQDEIAKKELEDKQKEEALRQRLHSEYYQRLTGPKQKEERPVEKVEREKKEEMQELEQKKAEKPKPLAVNRAERKTETFRGVSG